MKQADYDVIVIGAGHAGCEAAAASARCGARTALISLRRSDIGVMSCNPAIGGLGKGHLVCEVDALDGLMGRAADAAGIQFRLLNRRKGPAVRGPRAQADRALYRSAMQGFLRSQPFLDVIEDEVVDFLLNGIKIQGVELQDKAQISAHSVVLTSGTFLNGVIHIGDRTITGGRMGSQSVSRLARRIQDLGLPLGRLKTGTPPRLDGRTIAWDKLEKQKGDEQPKFFSSLTKTVAVAQVECGITRTCERTHEIIRANLSRSAMYGGYIESEGPRYCPSIEDKVVRFADKPSHQIFLEPEGLEDSTIYPNGISTSLPEDVQEEYVRSITGLEDAKLKQPGYAIEYDYVDPRALARNLRVRDVEGLFFAGQINGTTGYEEAAAQGLVAGLNAARFSKALPSANFERERSYIGVMIDDLVTQGVTEPYRMFTSRAEYRLALRADNADQRLSALGREIGVVGDLRYAIFLEKMEKMQIARDEFRRISVSAKKLNEAGVRIAADGAPRTVIEAFALPNGTLEVLSSLVSELNRYDPQVIEQLSCDAMYEPYLRRQKDEVARIQRDESVRIPNSLDFREINGLSNELMMKLETTRPETLGQASRMQGMTPSALTLILAWIRKTERVSA